MIEVKAFSTGVTGELVPVQQHVQEAKVGDSKRGREPERSRTFRQVLQFGMVGILNSLVDVLVLNGLLWLFPTTSTHMLLIYNSVAFCLGAINSFFLNKYWTFRQRQQTTLKEVARFALTTMCGLLWSDLLLWLASAVIHPMFINVTAWTNISKVVAIASAALFSYLGMRLWVFVRSPLTGHAGF